MKSKVKSSINYTGTVTLSMYRGSKKIKLLQVHNKGNNQLFEFLGHCFLGETALAEAKRPSKIRLLSIPDSGDLSPASSGFIGIFSPPTVSTSEGSCKITYSFLIPRDQFTTLTTVDNLGLGLYSKNTSVGEEYIYDYVAICKFGELPKKLTATDLVINSSLVVDWELSISNV